MAVPWQGSWDAWSSPGFLLSSFSAPFHSSDIYQKLNCILHPQIDEMFSKAATCREESVASPGFPSCRDFTFPALGDLLALWLTGTLGCPLEVLWFWKEV